MRDLKKILEEWVTVDSITIQDAGVKEKITSLMERRSIKYSTIEKKSNGISEMKKTVLHLYRYIMSMFDKRQAI